MALSDAPVHVLGSDAAAESEEEQEQEEAEAERSPRVAYPLAGAELSTDSPPCAVPSMRWQ